MYVPAPHQPLVRRVLRRAAWMAGDSIAAAISAVRGFRVPDEPLQPFALKLPMLLGTYERSTVEQIKKLVRPGMVVVDGGAHAGYMTKLFSRLVGPAGRVLAFEIHPETLDLLRNNTRCLKNVEVIPAALGHADGSAKIFTSKISSGHSATPTKPGLTEGAGIPVRSIASILKERGLQRLHFLKLDIEGGEPAVLRSLPDGPMTILFEVKRYILEGAGESPEALLLEMLDQGFSLRTDDGRQTIDRTSLACPSKGFDKANLIAER